MLSFSTDEAKYSFEIDGKPYTLPALTLERLEDVERIVGEEPAKQSRLVVEFYEKVADKRTMTALRKLPLRNLGELFLDWAGVRSGAVTPGESEGSPEA